MLLIGIWISCKQNKELVRDLFIFFYQTRFSHYPTPPFYLPIRDDFDQHSGNICLVVYDLSESSMSRSSYLDEEANETHHEETYACRGKDALEFLAVGLGALLHEVDAVLGKGLQRLDHLPVDICHSVYWWPGMSEDNVP